MSLNQKITSQHLDRIIVIQKRTIGRAGNGAGEDTWADEFTNVPAKVEQKSTADVYRADQIEGQFDYIITIRFKPSLNEKDFRVVYQGRILELVGHPKEVGRRQLHELKCKARST